MPRRRRTAKERRRFTVTLEVLSVVANGAEVWRDYFGTDADLAWAALRDQLGHAGAADWRTALQHDEVDPRDAAGRTGSEIAAAGGYGWPDQAADEEEGAPWQ